ncbi:Lipopolysaccharide kinase (Kdo/WaaP) family protein [Methylophilus rhizosphaerae]|uniref:Lipopolysaccharide kinase (Kdo/WaaP) family protein n=2 Tax=Methylophilus rhizosphaerae TaxID=492660 RepID=A0A1G9BK33_9PROT|nr:Lipopolysaccharide kinase (Kdo/WaaP) family protein [Methylophilus rhizosphaerae]
MFNAYHASQPALTSPLVFTFMQGQIRSLTECEVVDSTTGYVWLEHGEPLTDLQAHRVIPQRRWVLSAHWQGQAVFAKIFLGQQAEKYATRDARGARWLQQGALTTPALLWQGVTQDGRAQVLIYAAVTNAQNAEELYQSADVAARLVLVERLVIALAQQHQAGLVQTDLHLKNFLMADEAVWTIDGDGIRKKTLSTQAAYQQLATLISKLSVLDQQAWIDRLLTVYQQQRQWHDDMRPAQVLAWAMRDNANAVREYVERKIFRNCTDVVWQQTPLFVLARHAAAMLPALTPEALESAMQAGNILKDGNSSTVVQTPLAQQEVVIKRYNIKHIAHALSRAWRPSRAAASWSNAHRLQYYGFLTPQPLAMLEQRRYGLRGKAYFISAYSGLPDAVAFFRTVNNEVLRQEALRQLALTCYQFYLLHIVHGDLKATNLQVDPRGKIIVMDLDSMRQYRCAKRALRAHVADIRRLLQNWKDDTSLYNALVNSFQAVYADATPLKLAGISI